MSEFKATMLFENMVGEHPEDVKPVLIELCVVSDTAHGALRKAADFIEARAGITVKRVDVVEVTVDDKHPAGHKPVMVVTDLIRDLPLPRHGQFPHLMTLSTPGIGNFYRESISDDAPTMDCFDFKDTLKALDDFKDSWFRPTGLINWLLNPKVVLKTITKGTPPVPEGYPTVFAEGPLPKAMGLGHFRITRSEGGAGWTDQDKAKK
jgi:hypothetical protein